MALTGFPLAFNSLENIACYRAGEPGALGFDTSVVPCAQDGGKAVSLDWALPCTENGVSVTGFEYQKAFNNIKPRADAVKVITIIDYKNGGSYMRVLVPDTYTIDTFVQACCAGCQPIPAVAIPDPILGYTECVPPVPTQAPCVSHGAINLPPLTGGNTVWVLAPVGSDLTGSPIVFAPATVKGTTAAVLASAAQTGWAAEMGNGIFVATGSNFIEYTATGTQKVGFQVTQALS